MTVEELQALQAQSKRLRSGNQEIENHPIPDQIALDRYLAEKELASSRGSPIRRQGTIPPGAV